jgi:CheY-specific phosphatase CheX
MSATNKELINLIDKAIEHTFMSFFSILPVLTKVDEFTISNFNSEPNDYDISSVIAFIEDQLDGTLALRFHKMALLKAISKVYTAETATVDHRALGAIGELVNTIYGIIKQNLNQKGYNYQMCVPVIVIGSNHSICSTFQGKKIQMLYQLLNDRFLVEIVLQVDESV